jgi:hypothetical protein
MVMRSLLASLSAAALVATPIAAQAAPRQATPVEGEEIAGNPWIPIVVLITVLAAILVVASDDNGPTSP